MPCGYPDAVTDDAPGTIGWIQVDCADPEALARFWLQLLGVEIDGGGEVLAARDEPAESARVPSGLDTSCCVLSPERASRSPSNGFPESKAAKNRVHLDIVAAQGLERSRSSSRSSAGHAPRTETSTSTAGDGGL
jgi:hypothetical protein